jgi:hypothetical protein
LIAYQSLKKVAKAQPGEKETAKAVRLAKVEAAKEELNKAKIAESSAWLMISFGNCYETTQNTMGSNRVQDAHQKSLEGFDGCQTEQPLHVIATIT